jgi:hypothetical protein
MRGTTTNAMAPINSKRTANSHTPVMVGLLP